MDIFILFILLAKKLIIFKMMLFDIQDCLLLENQNDINGKFIAQINEICIEDSRIAYISKNVFVFPFDSFDEREVIQSPRIIKFYEDEIFGALKVNVVDYETYMFLKENGELNELIYFYNDNNLEDKISSFVQFITLLDQVLSNDLCEDVHYLEDDDNELDDIGITEGQNNSLEDIQNYFKDIEIF